MFDKKKMQDFTDKYVQRVKEKPVSTLTEEEAVHSYGILIDIVGYHNWLYYVSSQPIIADEQYDLLFLYVKDIEKSFPQILRDDSPTQRLICQLQNDFLQAHHSVPLLSLENSYNAQDLTDWAESTRKTINKLKLPVENENRNHDETTGINIDDHYQQYTPYSFICEPKYDGISVELIYEYGKFTRAITRGDGYVGEDITANIRTIMSVPLTLQGGADIIALHVRGEVVMSKKALERVNQERAIKRETLFANVRNAASGSLRQLDTSITAKRGLLCYIYEVLLLEVKEDSLLGKNSVGLQATTTVGHSGEHSLQTKGFLTHIGLQTDTAVLQWLGNQGFMMHQWMKHVQTIEEVIAICESPTTKNYFDAEDIEFDGIVIKINELDIRQALGSTNHHPRWAMAYKFPAKQVVTRIVSVDYQVGRTGVITPTANLESIELSGVKISRASLHNFDYTTEKDIKIGDWVWLQRSGEVIPYVVSAIAERRTGSEAAIVVPTHCPICGGELAKVNGDIYVYCTNVACPAKISGQILYYVSRDAANIDGVGDALVEILIKQGLVKNIADLYMLDETQARLQLLSMNGIGQKKYFELIEELKKSKVNPLWRLLNGLGILGIGKKTAQIIVTAISEALSEKEKEAFSIYDLERFLCDDAFLLSIKGIGPETVTSVQTWFSNDANKTMLEKMAERGVAWNIFDTKRVIKGKLTGISFCISGTFEIPRKILADILAKHGAVVTDAITQQTSFLIVGENASSKVAKARDYNIPLLEGIERLEQKFDFLKNDVASMKLFTTKEKKANKPRQEGLF